MLEIAFCINFGKQEQVYVVYDPEEIDKRMDVLGSRLAETHDKKIIKELYELAREREKVDQKSRE